MLLKEVSKAKHRILRYYFPVWATILGSACRELAYVDCYAGPGVCGDDLGSPLIAAQVAAEVATNKGIAVRLLFVERSRTTARTLEENLHAVLGYVPGVQYTVIHGDVRLLIDQIVGLVGPSTPAFYFIDPFGFPMSVPTIRQLLSRRRTEVLLNLMWMAVPRNMKNGTLDGVFGHERWRDAQFVGLSGHEQEAAFLDYFCEEVGAPFRKHFRVCWSPDEHRGHDKTKYYLVHFCTHAKAALLMRRAMFAQSEARGSFSYAADPQLHLDALVDTADDLMLHITMHYVGSGRVISFQNLQLELFDLPFVEGDIRGVLRAIEEQGGVKVERVVSKVRGIRDKDILHFSC